MARVTRSSRRKVFTKPHRVPYQQAMRLFTALLSLILLCLVTFPLIPSSKSKPYLSSSLSRTIKSNIKNSRFQLSRSLESAPSKEWTHVIRTFLSTSPHFHYRSDRMRLMHKRNRSFTCALVTITNGHVSIEWSKSSRAAKYFHPGRFQTLQSILTTLSPRLYHINVTVLVDLTDGLKRPPATTFSIVRAWRAWTSAVPVPLGSTYDETNVNNSINGWNEGFASPVIGWNSYAMKHIVSTWIKYPWRSKLRTAVFRGKLKVCAYVLGTCNFGNAARCERAEKWDQCSRGVLFRKTRRYKRLFDVAFTKWSVRDTKNFHQMDGAPVVKDKMKYIDFQKHKYILNVGSNQDWSDRLRNLLFMNSVIVHHVSEATEFFTPLLKPWVHFVPFNLNMSDLVTNMRYAVSHDIKMQNLRVSQHDFAKTYLSEGAMLEYWRIALIELAKRQQVADREFEEALRTKNEQETASQSFRHNHHRIHPPQSQQLQSNQTQ